MGGLSFPKFLWIAVLILVLSLLTLHQILFQLWPPAAVPTGLPGPLIVVVAMGGVLLLASGWLYHRSFSARLERLTKFVENLPEAASSDPAQLAAGDDLAGLAQSLVRAVPRVRGPVDRLRLEAARREAILASMVEGVLAVDREFKVTFCNEAFARSFGASGPIARGVPVVKLVRDPELLDMLRKVLVSGESSGRRLQLSAADGHWFEVQCVPMDAPSGEGALAVLHDITHQERLERIRRDFVANVSHELRTPLAAIRGYAETLLSGGLEDPGNRRRFVEIIEAHAIRLNNIASDLLVLSELESGVERAQPERCSIAQTLEAALRTVESEASVRRVEVVRGPIDEVDVQGHRLRLEQAFVNLLDNAIKFNHPGGEVRLATSRTASGQVRITVSDTGVGIPSEDLPRIFERFYRVDRARSREVGGTGLGLSIVKHVVEQMHGTVTVESQLGRGSTFTVVLPPA